MGVVGVGQLAIGIGGVGVGCWIGFGEELMSEVGVLRSGSGVMVARDGRVVVWSEQFGSWSVKNK